MNKNIQNRLLGNERKYVNDVLDSEFCGSKSVGMTTRLEELFVQKFSSRYAVSFINGTVTMHAALEAFGIGFGDDVIVYGVVSSDPNIYIQIAIV